MDYPVETFSADERALLEPHCSNLDRPVFTLLGLPETVKGALFARYSRYAGTLRRLMVDEFADDLREASAGGAREGDGAGRAAQLYERIFLGYGDDSVAQLGGAHLACEWCSNVLTKVLQRPRLAAYLEQSTRYIAYDAPIPGGGYRYYSDPELGPEYPAAMDELFSIYAALLPRVTDWAATVYPAAPDDSPAAHRRAVTAKALDLLRGLLPAASLSHMGVYASGQTYEQLILHLLAHPLPEARAYGAMMLPELQTVIPSFLTRVERPDRGGAWVDYLQTRAQAGDRWAQRLGLTGAASRDSGPSVSLVHVDGDEEDLLCALLFEASATSEVQARDAVRTLDDAGRAAMLAELVGARENRRHRPGRGFESVRYRFEIVADYGAFRDLQRHRMLTVQWQALTPDLGADVPDEIVQGRRRGRLSPRTCDLRRRLRPAGRPRADRRGPLRAVPRLPDAVRARPQRTRGDAADRAALRARGPSQLPRRRPRDARRDRRGPPVGRRRDAPRRRRDRAAPGADPGRDAHPGPRRGRLSASVRERA